MRKLGDLLATDPSGLFFYAAMTYDAPRRDATSATSSREFEEVVWAPSGW